VIRQRLAAEHGDGVVSALLLLAGVLLPLFFLIPLAARLELAQLTLQQTARDAARAASEAATPPLALPAAQAALARARASSRLPLQLSLRGSLIRGATISATVSAPTEPLTLPGLGSVGGIRLSSTATVPVDRYRSLPAP